MTRLWTILVVLALAGCAARPPERDRDDLACPRGVAGTYALVFTTRAPTSDDAKSFKDLSQQGELGFGHVALGLTEVNLALATHYTYSVAPALADGVCAYPSAVAYRLSFADRVVHVAHEFAGEPCLRAAVLEHEMRHVALDDRIFAAEIPRLNAGLAARLDAGRGIWGRDAAEADAALRRRLQEAGTAMVAELGAIRRVEHRQQIDTPEEQQRIRQVCGGRLLQLDTVAAR
ncbi:MAG TPA: hypothetical protein VFC38_03140 [Stellaceae bacterium]|nr:hypothetical protein [Stellaceae bacterium]